MSDLPLGDWEERFWSKIDRRGPEDCWNWRSPITRGYGYLSINNKHYKAHRIAWMLANGPIPDGMHCCHRCDNALCCNPGHLFPGTPRDNIHDMIKKGRYRSPQSASLPGSLNPCSKLTEEQAVYAMARILAGEARVSIGRAFGVHHSAITRIWWGLCWSHAFTVAQEYDCDK